jgi:diguanylate cyclase (GGDEF)-like protein
VLSAHNRILLLLGGLAVTATLTIQVVFVVTDAARATIQAESERSFERQSAGDDLAVALRDEQEGVSDYLLGGDPSSLARYEAAVRLELEAVGRIRADVAAYSTIADAVDKVSAASGAWRNDFGQPAIAAALSGTSEQRQAAGRLTVQSNEAVQGETAELVSALDAVDLDLHEQTLALNGTRAMAIELGVAFEVLAAGISLLFVRRYGLKLTRDAGRASVLNRFTEATTFAADDEAVATLNIEALELLVKPDAAVIHVLNRSKDRAVPEAQFGAAIAEVLPLHALSGCPGVVRGSIFVTDDASAPLSVHCPVYPAHHGTVACVPLAHGDNVGAVHLYWDQPARFPLHSRPAVARIAEHAALAIANRRLLAALQGQADTDARTGLSNSRAFDAALESALSTAQAGESLGVLMLDLDHFKDVNDRHGHPAGDEALRVFSGVLRSCMRDGDLAARYGGEEFAVLLARVDAAGALAVAERIRARIESTLISLAPGVTERLTVSIGVALAPDQGIERLSLLRLADQALYDAKQAGRNRVAYLGPSDASGSLASGRGGSAGQLGGKSESPARDPEAIPA